MKNTNFIDKEQFIKLLSQTSGFTQKDSGDFLDSLISVLGDCVAERKEVRVRGFGKLRFFPIKSRKGYNPKQLQYIDYPEAEKIIFTLSHYIKSGKNEDPDSEEFEFDEV